jgi:hypothetical protein
MIDAQFHIGKILDDTARRDAVHFALAPVIASEQLSPGQHIGFVRKNVVGPCDEPLGIVDPFLPIPVYTGDRFWMFLYPNTITSLRHEWSHDEFDAIVETQPQNPMAANLAPSENFSFDDLHANSKSWLIRFSEQMNLSYDELMEAAENSIKYGDYISDGGKWEGFNTPSEFWRHYEIITGKSVEDHDANFFSCSC